MNQYYHLIQGEVHGRNTGKIALIGSALERDVTILYLTLGFDTSADELGKLLGIVEGISILEIEPHSYLIMVPNVSPGSCRGLAFLKLYINCLEQRFPKLDGAEIHFARFISKTNPEGAGVVFCLGPSTSVEGMMKSGSYSLYFMGILNRTLDQPRAIQAAEAALEELESRIGYVAAADVVYHIADNRFIAVLEVTGEPNQRTYMYLTRAFANNLAAQLPAPHLEEVQSGAIAA